MRVCVCVTHFYATIDGIRDEEASTRQPSVGRVVPITFAVSGCYRPAPGQQEEFASKTWARRKRDHRLIRSNFTRSQAWCICLLFLNVSRKNGNSFFLNFIKDYEKVSSGAVRPTFDMQRTWLERQPSHAGFPAYLPWHRHHPSGNITTPNLFFSFLILFGSRWIATFRFPPVFVHVACDSTGWTQLRGKR